MTMGFKHYAYAVQRQTAAFRCVESFFHSISHLDSVKTLLDHYNNKLQLQKIERERERNANDQQPQSTYT